LSHSIHDDVVEGHEEPGLVVAEPDERHAQERARFEIEGSPCDFARDFARLRLALGLPQRAQVHREPFGIHVRSHALLRPSVHRHECRAQRLVAPDEPVQGRAQGGLVEGRARVNRQRLVVRGHCRRALVEEPELLLRRGERQRPTSLDGRERSGKLACALLFHLDSLGELRQRRCLEQRAERQLDAELPFDTPQDLRGLERIAAEGEEAICEADPLPSDRLLEDARERALGGGLGRVKRRCLLWRNGQGSAIELAVHGEG
jgi:hypothetical protein